MKLFYLVVAFLFLTQCFVFAVPAEVEKLSNPEYFEVVHKSISEAKQSIFVVMYYIAFNKNQSKSKVSILVNDLVQAKERGVDVKVILDQTAVFSRTDTGRKKMTKEEKNRQAFNYLKTKGVNVLYDKLPIYTHGKCIIIDGETVIIGSHNWTKNSITRSNEYSVLIKDKELAQDLLADFEKIQIDHEASSRQTDEYITFNKDIMIDILNGFVSNSNDYCWNVYMYLVGHYPADTEIDFDYDIVARYLGITDKMEKTRYRESLRYNLRQLQNDYKLLTCEFIKGQNAKVVLKPYGTGKNSFQILKKFWTQGWDMRLTMSGRYCYFINLIEGGLAHNPWSMSKKNLIKKYKVGKERISEGMAELRHWNVLDIEYGDIAMGKGYDSRRPNRYRLKDLYDIKDFEIELNKLYEKYTKERIEEARKYAKIVFSENNLVDIEEIIKLIDEYGKDKVAWAFKKISNRSEDNPKRTMAYVIGILRNED